MSPVRIDQISTLPQLDDVLDGWTAPITLNKVTQTVVNYIPQDALTPASFNGTIQPLSARQIELKPEGQRAFTWLQIHVRANGPQLDLTDNDRINGLPYPFNGRTFKVQGVLPYQLNGFVEYHAVEDFTP